MAGGLFAAVEPPAANDSLIVVIGGIVVAAIGALGLVLVEVVKGRNSRTVPPSPAVDVVGLAEDVAVLKDWRRETRKADDIHDRTVIALVQDTGDIVAWLNRNFPEWRS